MGVPTNERSIENNRGSWCKYKDILCQEGYCSGCEIYKEAEIVGSLALRWKKYQYPGNKISFMGVGEMVTLWRRRETKPE